MKGDGRHFLVNARFLTQTLTGVQRYAWELVRAMDGLATRGALDHERHPVVLLVPRNARPPETGLGRFSLRGVGRFGGNLWSQFELPRHATGGVLWSPCNTGPVRHNRHVVTIHDASVMDHPEWYGTRFAAWYRLLLPRLAGNAIRILTVSEFSRGRLAETLDVDPGRISVVPNAVAAGFAMVGPDDARPVLKRLGLPPNYVLALGSIEPRKNIDGLLKAWALLLSRSGVGRDAHLVVAGARSSLFRAVGISEMPERVVFTGYLADSDLPAVYSGARAFVYPSLYEGFGLPPLEAMACGVPVLTSATTSIPEVVGDAALLVDPHETESIAEGLRSVLGDDDLREELRAAGFDRVRLFSWADSARLVWKHLAEAANQ